MKKRFYLFFLILLLFTACSSSNVKSTKGVPTKIAKVSPFKIDDTTYIAKGKNERIQFIVIHYTAGTNEASIKELISERASSHYLILAEDNSNKIYGLVPDNERAWHAGASSFRGRTNLNDTSIGIEIVNEGILKEYWNYPTYNLYEHYIDFEKKQIEKVAFLIKELAEKYNVPSRNIVAHSDIAPSRKKDPGPKFPWKMLYEKYNIGAWYDEEDKLEFMNEEEFSQKTIREIKNEFKEYGYDINSTNEWDKSSQDVIYAFQLHFNPENLTAEMDLETYAILKALNKKYVYKK